MVLPCDIHIMTLQILVPWKQFLEGQCHSPGRGKPAVPDAAAAASCCAWACWACWLGCKWRCVWECACVCACVCAWYSGEMPAICSRTMGSVARASRSAASNCAAATEPGWGWVWGPGGPTGGGPWGPAGPVGIPARSAGIPEELKQLPKDTLWSNLHSGHDKATQFPLTSK
jgi:hypothetical protein